MQRSPAISQLLHAAHICAATPLLGPQRIQVLFRGIRLSEECHMPRNTYLKVSVDDREEYSNKSNPGYMFESPVLLNVFPSSEIKISFYCQHAVRKDEHIGDIYASTWTLLSEENLYNCVQTHAKTRPHIKGYIDMRIRDPAVPVGNSEANMEEAKHRWALHYLRAEARSRSSNSEVPSSSVDIICEYIEHVLEAFDIMSTSLPIFKVALVLMSAVQKSLKTLNNVDEAIKNLFRMLSETIKKAQACCTSQPDSRFPDIFERIARLAVTSAAVVDRWMRKNTLLRVFAAGHVQDGLKRCQCDLKKVQDELQFDLAAHPRAPESTAASVATAQPEPTVLDTPEVTQEEPSGWRQSFHNGVNVWSIFPTRRTPSPPHGFIRSEPKRQDSDRARSPSPVGSLFAASRDPQRYLGTASFEEQPCTPPRGLAMPLPRVPVAPTMPLPNASEEYVVVSEPLTESNPYEHWNYGTQDDQDSAPPPYPMDYYAADDWHRGYTHPQA